MCVRAYVPAHLHPPLLHLSPLGTLKKSSLRYHSLVQALSAITTGYREEGESASLRAKSVAVAVEGSKDVRGTDLSKYTKSH